MNLPTFLFRYWYGNKEHPNDKYPTAWSRTAVFCSEHAMLWLHPMYDFIRKEGTAAAGERCVICELEKRLEAKPQMQQLELF